MNWTKTKVLYELTDNHIYPQKMKKKMKVSCAAHVFSQKVGAIMKRLPLMLITSNEQCPAN